MRSSSNAPTANAATAGAGAPSFQRCSMRVRALLLAALGNANSHALPRLLLDLPPRQSRASYCPLLDRFFLRWQVVMVLPIPGVELGSLYTLLHPPQHPQQQSPAAAAGDASNGQRPPSRPASPSKAAAGSSSRQQEAAMTPQLPPEAAAHAAALAAHVRLKVFLDSNEQSATQAEPTCAFDFQVAIWLCRWFHMPTWLYHLRLPGCACGHGAALAVLHAP